MDYNLINDSYNSRKLFPLSIDIMETKSNILIRVEYIGVDLENLVFDLNASKNYLDIKIKNHERRKDLVYQFRDGSRYLPNRDVFKRINFNHQISETGVETTIHEKYIAILIPKLELIKIGMKTGLQN